MEEKYLDEEMPSVKARIILEMQSRDKDRLAKALKLKSQKLKDNGLDIIKEKQFPPEEKDEGIFSAFVEFEANFKDAADLSDFSFDNMPSTIDLLEPSQLTLSAKFYTDLINDILARLHQVDLILARLKQRASFLDSNTVATLRNFLYHLCGEKERGVDEISKIVGIKSEEIKPFLDKMVELNSLTEKDSKYSQIKQKSEKTKKE